MTSALDSRQQLSELRLQGAHQLDPVRFHYLETLAMRLPAVHRDAQRVLEAKLAAALAAYRARFEQARSGTESVSCPAAPVHRPSLAGLIPMHAGTDASHPELKSLRYFRNTWSKLSVDRQVKKAFEQGPENAGPLNSHRLVLRSLQLMRDISPDYLNRFMSHVDALLWLDQADPKNKAAVKKPPRRKRQ